MIERINQQPRRQIANADAVVFFKTARRVVEKINLSRRLTFVNRLYTFSKSASAQAQIELTMHKRWKAFSDYKADAHNWITLFVKCAKRGCASSSHGCFGNTFLLKRRLRCSRKKLRRKKLLIILDPVLDQSTKFNLLFQADLCLMKHCSRFYGNTARAEKRVMI